jgi:hypothetical protein
MLETATETLGRNAYSFGFKISKLPKPGKKQGILFMILLLLILVNLQAIRQLTTQLGLQPRRNAEAVATDGECPGP